MRKLLVAAALVALALPAAAPARPLAIGMGDQKYSMFADKRFRWLGLHEARLVVSWNVMERSDWERPWIGHWLRDARAAGISPLVAFGHQWTGPGRKTLPSVAAYRRAIALFRSRYPWVREFTPWNEANHCSQPTCHRPERAAAYFDAVRDACPTCTVVAADVLDQRGMESWLRAFRRAARHRPALWGLHNYLDANRFRSSGTQRMLHAVDGPVWITETGGVVRRTHYSGAAAFPESPEHAAKATKWILGVARSQPRVRRVYLYQWNADSLFQIWDSGFIDAFGQRRPAFAVLARALGRDPSSAPADEPFHNPQQAPPSGGPPPTSAAPAPVVPAPQPSPGPAPAPCLLVVLCPSVG